MGNSLSKLNLSALKTAAGLSPVQDPALVTVTAQTGLHIGKNEQVVKKDTTMEKKVEALAQKRGI
jgi:hypothetical protein